MAIPLTDQEAEIHQKRQLIAEASGHPGYKYLVEIFQEEVTRAEEELAYSDKSTASSKLYYWQVMRHVAKVLKERPEQISEEVKRLREIPADENIYQHAPADVLELLKKTKDYYRTMGIEFPPADVPLNPYSANIK